MTEKLYWKDAYMKESKAKVVSVSGNEVLLDSTVFYPTSGGQLNDLGTMSSATSTYEVVDVKKSGDDVLHTLKDASGLSVGTELDCRIDWNRRYSLMRYHTAFHIVGAVMEKSYHAKFTGGMIYVDRAHMDWDMPELNRELAEKILGAANDVVGQRRKVISRFIGQGEALAIPDLVRTEPGRELIKRLDTVRIVEIEGFDVQMDGGTHVLNTSEVGRIELGKFENKGAHRKRMEIKLL